MAAASAAAGAAGVDMRACIVARFATVGAAAGIFCKFAQCSDPLCLRGPLRRRNSYDGVTWMRRPIAVRTFSTVAKLGLPCGDRAL